MFNVTALKDSNVVASFGGGDLEKLWKLASQPVTFRYFEQEFPITLVARSGDAIVRKGVLDEKGKVKLERIKKRKAATSRVARWGEACADASAALDKIESHLDDLEAATATIAEIKSEYEDWQSNMSENLANSPTGEKLQGVVDLDVDEIAQGVRDAVDEARTKIDDAEGVDLPLGWGKD